MPALKDASATISQLIAAMALTHNSVGCYLMEQNSLLGALHLKCCKRSALPHTRASTITIKTEQQQNTEIDIA